MIFGTLQTVLAFVVTLGILVSIHEFGHFWVARRCGVKVFTILGWFWEIPLESNRSTGDGILHSSHPARWLCQNA